MGDVFSQIIVSWLRGITKHLMTGPREAVSLFPLDLNVRGNKTNCFSWGRLLKCLLLSIKRGKSERANSYIDLSLHVSKYRV